MVKYINYFCDFIYMLEVKKVTEKNIQEIINHLKTSGFVYQNSEIYGGITNTWDYGPYAINMLNAIKK